MSLRIKKRKSEELVKVRLDISTLNTFIKYLRCEHVSPDQMRVLNVFINTIDLPSYEYDKAIYDRIKTVRIISKAYEDCIKDEMILRSMITDEYPDGIAIIDEVGFEKNQLSTNECDHVFKSIESRVHAFAIYKSRGKIMALFERFNMDSFDISFYDLINDLKDSMNTLIADLQHTTSSRGILKRFSFGDKDAASILQKVLHKSKLPSSVLQTGIRQLNANLAPGFRPTRLYTIIGGSGKFKSGTLLNLCDQIRMFNPQINPYENGVRKTILFVTLENTIEESIVRLYDMYSGINENFEDSEIDNIISTFQDNGRISIGGNDGIDIDFMYAGNLAVDSKDIQNEIDRLRRDDDKEVIAVVVDYIKRLNSIHPNNGDERVRISYVSKELKNLATEEEIPVITAMQLNREGNAILDAAMRENKQDVARFVGTSSIGNAWDIIEESDWVGLINLEMQKSTNKLFLTIKALKKRFKVHNGTGVPPADYFNHPFVNEKNIRLLPDIDLPECASIISLASDLVSINEQEDEDDKIAYNASNRPTLNSVGKGSNGVMASLTNNNTFNYL